MEVGGMRFPIDTSRLRFMVVVPAEAVLKFEEGRPREAWEPRKDASGAVLHRLQLVAMGDGDGDIIRVQVPGDPKVGQGEMVRVSELTVEGWEFNGQSGTSYRAAAIRSEGRSGGQATEKQAGGGS
jgi:hypothetical protein